MSESLLVVSDFLRPHGLYNPWNSPGQNTGVGKPFPSPGDLPNPGMEPRPPVLQADSLPAEPPGERAHSCSEWGLLSSCDVWASHFSGFSCCGAQALGRSGFSSCRAGAQ